MHQENRLDPNKRRRALKSPSRGHPGVDQVGCAWPGLDFARPGLHSAWPGLDSARAGLILHG